MYPEFVDEIHEESGPLKLGPLTFVVYHMMVDPDWYFAAILVKEHPLESLHPIDTPVEGETTALFNNEKLMLGVLTSTVPFNHESVPSGPNRSMILHRSWNSVEVFSLDGGENDALEVALNHVEPS